MPELAISVQEVSKAYRIGVGTRAPDTLAGALGRAIGGPLRNFRRLRGLTRFSKSRAEEGRIWALREVSFDIPEGQVTGVIGRNGAGKSTLLKILSRITCPTIGRVLLKGRVSSLLEVGTGFHPELTGRENIYLNGTILGMRKTEIDVKFDSIVEFSGVERFLDTPLKRYSSGMGVRLAFSVAAHLEPEILLVDEVLAVGDLAFQEKCVGKMRDVAREGRTVVFVSHNLASIAALCSKSCLLVDGRVELYGESERVLSEYVRHVRGAAEEDLGARKDRSGNGSMVFTNVAIEDREGRAVDAALSGSDLSVILRYRAESPPRRVLVALTFYGSYGEVLLVCSNEMTEERFELLPKEGEICCVLPRLPFSAGSYSVNIYCEVEGELADWVQDAFRLSVSDGDFYGTGRVPPATHGGFLAAQRWTHREN